MLADDLLLSSGAFEESRVSSQIEVRAKHGPAIKHSGGSLDGNNCDVAELKWKWDVTKERKGLGIGPWTMHVPL
jgi:hypothetical protein